GSLVVDALGDPARAREARTELEALTRLPVVGLVLTHAHDDHSFGAPAFADVPLWAHAGLRAHLEAVERPQLGDPGLEAPTPASSPTATSQAGPPGSQ